MSLRVSPLCDGLPYGARVHGVTEAILQEERTHQQLRTLFQDRGLILFEEVEPRDGIQLAISRIYGRTKNYRPKDSTADDAEISIDEMKTEPGTSTIVEIDGKQLSGWLPWHFDQCYNRTPNRARVLRCQQAPPSGGLTGFLDGMALYESISRGLREELDGRSVLYEMDMHLAHMRFGVPDHFRVLRETPKFSLDPWPVLPRASHPAVVTRPSGRKLLHVSPWMANGVVGIDGEMDPRGHDLLEAVSKEICSLGRSSAYYHQWRPTDLLIWDNRRMLHSATGCDPAFTRTMCRTTILED
jgi:taurine dioxygenase